MAVTTSTCLPKHTPTRHGYQIGTMCMWPLACDVTVLINVRQRMSSGLHGKSLTEAFVSTGPTETQGNALDANKPPCEQTPS